MPWIAISTTIYNFFHYNSHYSIALNLIFTAPTLSPTFPNLQSSLLHIKPMPSRVRNHYSLKDQEAHLQRALAFKKAANHYCSSDVCLPIAYLCACDWGLLMCAISLIKKSDDTVLVIGDDECEDTTETTFSSEIEETCSNHQLEVQLLREVHREKSLSTTWVPLPKTWSCANTVIACPPLPISWNPAVAMAPPWLKRQKSTPINKLSESAHAPSA